ncbi:MAG: type II toxin-antitoxin system Phd/YefM family antitoxin [Immundisolibacter sp.]|uniref:type II toxin-antitoxin system Phd/YefM family antitoxin n=1 Tax=Immundisolibacter sp. TaxID=1934948 RepID=UPI003EDEF6C1
MEATKVGIREFRSGLAEYIASETPVAITRHGQTVGFFIPTKGQAGAVRAALKKAAADLDHLRVAGSEGAETIAVDVKAGRKTRKLTADAGRRQAP